MYLSLLFSAAISRMSPNRSTNTVDDVDTADASFVVRTIDGWEVDCVVAIVRPVATTG